MLPSHYVLGNLSKLSYDSNDLNSYISYVRSERAAMNSIVPPKLNRIHSTKPEQTNSQTPSKKWLIRKSRSIVNANPTKSQRSIYYNKDHYNESEASNRVHTSYNYIRKYKIAQSVISNDMVLRNILHKLSFSTQVNSSRESNKDIASFSIKKALLFQHKIINKHASYKCLNKSTIKQQKPSKFDHYFVNAKLGPWE